MAMSSGAVRPPWDRSMARSFPAQRRGSLPFLVQPTMRVLRTIKTQYGKAWSRYGFVNAFNPVEELVRYRCYRPRHWNHHADGGECADLICLEHLHEKLRSTERNATCRISSLSVGLAQPVLRGGYRSEWTPAPVARAHAAVQGMRHWSSRSRRHCWRIRR